MAGVLGKVATAQVHDQLMPCHFTATRLFSKALADTSRPVPARAYQVHISSKDFSAKQQQAARNWKPRTGNQKNDKWCRKCRLQVPFGADLTLPSSVEVRTGLIESVNELVKQQNAKAHKEQAQFVLATTKSGTVLLYQSGLKLAAEKILADARTQRKRKEAATVQVEEESSACKRLKADVLLAKDIVGRVVLLSRQQQAVIETIRRCTAERLKDSLGANPVYAMCSNGIEEAICKPLAHLTTSRQGLTHHDQTVNEEAAFVVDFVLGTQVVPCTTCTWADIEGNYQFASVQVWKHGAESVGNFGPSTLKEISQETVENVAVLDMSLFSLDRHDGNLLLLAQRKVLIAIDNALVLPHFQTLSEFVVSAWRGFPQIVGKPSAHAVALTQRAHDSIDTICDTLRKLSISEERILTLRITTLFLHIGVARCRKSLLSLLMLMERPSRVDSSWLEQQVGQAWGSDNFNVDSEDSLGTFLRKLEGSMYRALTSTSIAT